MQKYKSNITSTSGAAIRGVPVLVLTEAGEYAAIFLDRAGTVSAPNPLTTGADGTFYFYAVNGRYSLRTTVDGVTITDEDVVLMMDPQEITVAGPIAEAVAAAQAAAVAAEFAVEGSGIPELVNAAQNAALDANAATAQAAAAAALAESAKTDATAAKTAAEAAVTSANAAANSAALSATGAENSALAAAQIEAAIDPTSLRSRANHTGMQPVGTVTGLQSTLSALASASGISNTPAGGISATTVQAAINELDAEKAKLASPTFTGTPTAPTAAAGTNTIQLATTAYSLAAAAARYGKNNLLGTVSQSAGVPTGSVIERGSNANGEYVRFADGTQICSTVSGVSSSSVSTAWAFPAAFINTDFVMYSIVRNNTALFSSVAFKSATQGTFDAWNLSGARVVVGVELMAIGRWF